MKLNKAIDLAIECIRGSIKQVNFDANLFDKKLSDTPHAQKCSERRKVLLEVIQTLESLLGKNDWGKPPMSAIYKGKSDVIIELSDNKPLSDEH